MLEVFKWIMTIFKISADPQDVSRAQYLHTATLANVYRHAVDLIPALEYSITLKLYLKFNDPTVDLEELNGRGYVVTAVDLQNSPFWSILALCYIIGDLSEGQVNYYLPKVMGEDIKFKEGKLKDAGQAFDVDMVPRKALNKDQVHNHIWLRMNFTRMRCGQELHTSVNQAMAEAKTHPSIMALAKSLM